MRTYIVEEEKNLLNFDTNRAGTYMTAHLLLVEELVSSPRRGIRAMYTPDKSQVCLCTESAPDMYFYTPGTKFLFLYDISQTRIIQWGPANDLEACRTVH
jgi:hypothetical protein